MISPGPHSPTPYDDDWEDIPSGNGFMKWFVGVALAAAMIGYGVYCLFTGSTHLLGDRTGGMTVQGTPGIALAIAWMGAGLVLHCHYFWGSIYHLHIAATIGKIAGLLMFIGGLGVVLVRVGVYGR